MKNDNGSLKIQLLRIFIDLFVFLLCYFVFSILQLIQSAFNVVVPIIFANFFFTDVIIVISFRKKILSFKHTDVLSYSFFIFSFVVSVIMSLILYTLAISEGIN